MRGEASLRTPVGSRATPHRGPVHTCAPPHTMRTPTNLHLKTIAVEIFNEQFYLVLC